MGVEYDSAVGSVGVQDDNEALYGRELICRFGGFQRRDDGELLVYNKAAFGYRQDDDGQWAHKGSPVPEDKVPFDLAMNILFEVVSPVELAGEVVRYGCRIKGVRIGKNPETGLPTFGLPGIKMKRKQGSTWVEYKTGDMEIASRLGFDIKAMDVESELCIRNDKGVPVYVEDEVETLESPLTEEQVLVKIVEAKLLQARDVGHLVSVRTSDFSAWVQYASITALSYEQAERYHQAQASEDARAEELRNTLRGMAKSAPEGFATRVQKLALQVQSDVEQAHVLEQLTLATLEFVVKQLSEPESAEASSL